jgi:hypothetical protein
VLMGNVLQEQAHHFANRALQPLWRLRHRRSTGNGILDTAGLSVFTQEANGLALTAPGDPNFVQAFGAETFANRFSTSRATCGHTLQPTPTTPGD